MRKIFIILVFVNFIIFSPLAALAGSCECQYSVYGSGSNPICTLKGSATSQTDCTNQNGRDDGYGTYDLCEYFSNDYCSNQCQLDQLNSSEKICEADTDCAVGVGTAKCCQKLCYFDYQALQAFNSGQVSFMGWENSVKIKKPILSIKIPNVIFSDPKNNLDSEGNISSPFLAQYLSGVYKFAVAAGSLVAVIVIILNGFRITISAGGPEKNKGIQNIVKAITGLFILWSSYALFYTINPDLVALNVLKVKYVEPFELETEEQNSDLTVAASATSSLTAVKGADGGAKIYTQSNNIIIDQALLTKMQTAANSLQNKGIQMYVTSGLRPIAEQKALMAANCQPPDPSNNNRCVPLNGKPITCMLIDGKPNSCPHTTGKAVDVWAMKDGKRCVTQSQCGKDPNTDPCRNDPCQAALIQAMKDVGFCNLSSEAWHFESPKMSASCK